MFPFLFVTIACGAVSGFHSLVSSGTASKQIKNEKSMLPVSFGAMLMESHAGSYRTHCSGLFSSTAEAASMGYTTPTQIFAGGVSGFLQAIGLPQNVSYTLINLAVSAFALTSLDSVARVGRLSFQELFLDESIQDEDIGPVRKVLTNKYFATILTLCLAYLLAKAGYDAIWPLFGASNQLLSALAFLACAVFLKRTKRKSIMLWIPMFLMVAVTFTALTVTIWKLANGIKVGTYPVTSGVSIMGKWYERIDCMGGRVTIDLCSIDSGPWCSSCYPGCAQVAGKRYECDTGMREQKHIFIMDL